MKKLDDTVMSVLLYMMTTSIVLLQINSIMFIKYLSIPNHTSSIKVILSNMYIFLKGYIDFICGFL